MALKWISIPSLPPGAIAVASTTDPAGQTCYNEGSYTSYWDTWGDSYYVCQETAATSYTVTFKDWNGTTLKTQYVLSGRSATPPSNPTRSGYRFTGWSGTYTNVTSNRTITATYVKTYVVTFKGRDGETLKTQTVDTGGSATAPTPVDKKPWYFDGWMRSFTNVTSNITVESEWYLDTGLYYNDVMIKSLSYNDINLKEIDYNGSQIAAFETPLELVDELRNSRLYYWTSANGYSYNGTASLQSIGSGASAQPGRLSISNTSSGNIMYSTNGINNNSFNASVFKEVTNIDLSNRERITLKFQKQISGQTTDTVVFLMAVNTSFREGMDQAFWQGMPVIEETFLPYSSSAQMGPIDNNTINSYFTPGSAEYIPRKSSAFGANEYGDPTTEQLTIDVSNIVGNRFILCGVIKNIEDGDDYDGSEAQVLFESLTIV